MAISPKAVVTYRDEKGKEIAFQEFISGMAGRSFSKEVSDDELNATFQVNALDKPKPAESPASSLQIGDKMPTVSLTALDGTVFGNAEFDGKITLLNFFFSTCVPCIHEIPALNAYAGDHPDVATLAFTFDGADEARAFVAERDFRWRIVADAQAFIDALGIKTYPAFVLVGASGEIVAHSTSFMLASNSKYVMAPDLARWVDEKRRSLRR
jgi:thiol-disulfide isomerase/thioredoxin